ncbi:MAG: redoxin domain-containing protein [Bacteroidetes bacterium]|nr:redoxin domain-containing protein [Bacteroidota bacterium]
MYNLLTAISFLLAALSPALFHSGWNVPLWIIPIPAFIGWIVGLMLVKKITLPVHSAANISALLSYGYSIDCVCKTFPFILTALLLIGCTYFIRGLFITSLGYVKAKWLEPVLLFSGLSLYIFTNIHFGAGQWMGWVFPLPIIFFSLVGAVAGIKESKAFADGAKRELGVKIGSPAPDFSLNDENGNEVKLSEFRDLHPALLLFVRGDWCPTCHIMLRTYEKNSDQFRKRNVMILAIGPDPKGTNKEMVEKLSLSYRILSDDKQEALKLFGIQYLEPIMGQQYEVGSPLPASILLDKKGIVQFICRSDRAGEFLNPMQIFSVLENLN